ncbi:MAG TPA: hypothetical protein VEQ11_06440 [Chloroflexota bacterium]|nr:hypothetical protein [Chloroflexota bacterium]
MGSGTLARVRGRLPLKLLLLALGLLLGAASALADDVDRIDEPASGAHVSGQVEIRGRATGPDPIRFSFYHIHYGVGSSPSILRPIGPASDQPIVSGRLGVWDTSTLSPGEYLILLTVYDTSGNTTRARVVVTVDAPPPRPRATGQVPLVVPSPGESPVPEQPAEGTPGPTPDFTPPESPVQPVIVPAPVPPAPAPVPQVAPPPPPPVQPIAPIQQGPIQESMPPPLPINLPGSDAFPTPTPPSFDTGPGPAPIVVPGGPPVPIIQPYEPPPPQPTIGLPTPFGLP